MTPDICDSFSDAEKAKMMLKAIMLSGEQVAKYGHMFESYNSYYDNGSVYPNFSNEAMADDCEERRATSATSFKCGKNSFEAVVEREKETLVFFSIPYDEGWRAYVNGVEAPVEKVNVGFMAVPVSAGMSTIVFEYETPGLGTGFIISGVSVILLAAYMYLFKRVKEKTPEYPEGDELLNFWNAEDEEEMLPEEKEIINERTPKNRKRKK